MRVVSHTCSNTEIVCALGLQDYLIAVDDHSDFPQEVVARLPKTGKDLQQDVAYIASLKPDLVLTSLTVPGHEKIVAELESFGLPSLVVDPISLEGVMGSFVEIAKALGCEKKGLLLREDFQAKVKEVMIGVEPTRNKVMIEWWSKPSIVPCGLSWVNDMIQMAGGINPWGKYPLKSRVVEDAEVCEINPELMILAWCGVNTAKIRPDSVYRKESLKSVKAVKHKNVKVISEEFLGRPGPRLVEGLRLLVGLIQEMQSEY